jgi:ribosomal protein L34
MRGKIQVRLPLGNLLMGQWRRDRASGRLGVQGVASSNFAVPTNSLSAEIPRKERSGFRLRAPASLTPAKRLKFKSRRPDHLAVDIQQGEIPRKERSGFRLRASASLTPAKRLKFKSRRPDQFSETKLRPGMRIHETGGVRCPQGTTLSELA